MSKPLRLGLVSEGPLSPRALFRTPAVQAGLGPVRARSLRIASRLVNTLGAGRASQAWDDFEACRLVLISAPPAEMPRVIRALAAAPLNWEGRTVVACQDSREGVIEPLERKGAARGSIVCIEGVDPPRYIVEGTPAAQRDLRALFSGNRRSVIRVQPGMQAVVAAARIFAVDLVVPLLDAAAGCLRTAGIERKVSVDLVEQMVRLSLRRYGKAGLRAWRGGALNAHGDALLRASPRTAELLSSAAAAATEFLATSRLRPR